MKNAHAQLESPFLNETIVGGEPPGSDRENHLVYELDVLSSELEFEAFRAPAPGAGREAGDDETDLHPAHQGVGAAGGPPARAAWREAGDDETDVHRDHEGFGAPAWPPESEDEDDSGQDEADDRFAGEAARPAPLDGEAPCCAPSDEMAELEAELFDREAWSGSAEQLAFRDRVLAAHLARSRSRSGAPQRDLTGTELAAVPGTSIQMGRDAAAAAGRLLAAANAALASAQQAGDADAQRTVRLSATSGYRAADHQRRLWLKYFPGYYKRTRTHREGLGAGPHSEEAVTYMLKPKKSGGFGLGGRIAAPGYSNHQNGIAIDLWQERKKGHEVPNDSGDGPRKRWRDSWFHGWLKTNAELFGFKPIATEEWHWEHRGAGSATAGTPPPPTPAPSGSAGTKPGAELTRFVQRVLNAVEGEKLAVDGDFGSRTRAAVERFQRKHDLAGGGAVDAATELALAQRALEELAQASMFARAGVRDARTDQELIRFKSGRGLGLDPVLDAATRKALTDALAARQQTTPSPSPSPAPGTGAPTTPTALQGGKLWTFRAQVVSTPVAVFCPPAALGKSQVEVLVYAHGLLNGCTRPKSVPDGLISAGPFRLGAAVAGSNRPMVLVVPLLDWNHPGSKGAFGSSYPRWHALAKPAHLNALVDEALAEVGRVQSASPPSVSNLVIAGHSRAYDFMEPLAHLHADPAMQRGALARLSEVWSLDATYAGSVSKWKAWLAANPQLRAHVLYRPGSRTHTVGERFYKARGGRLSVTQASEGHCAMPGKRLPQLLAASASAVAQELEAEDTWGQDEALLDDLLIDAEGLESDDETTDGDDEAIEADDFVRGDHEDPYARDEYAYDELEDESAELERDLASDDETDDESDDETEYEIDDESFLDEEGEFEFEEELHAELPLEEEELGDKTPMAVPADNPVPFAPASPAGAFWPVRTTHKSVRLVSYMYQAPSGIVGRSGRMFLAGRKGKVKGKTVGRWHAGVDLFAYKNDPVVACEAGTIVHFSHFYTAKSGQSTYKLLIEHEGSGIVINYGEVRKDSLKKNGLAVGMRVSAGQQIGWVSDTSMLHFETYVKGTTESHRWWKSKKDPPRELLNPTRYLLELARAGLTATATGGVDPAPAPAPDPSPAPSKGSSTTKPAAELVRFAQRVLNISEGERLKVDGDLGKLTRAALTRFRQRYGIGAGGVLDEPTTLGLAQRALEELKQASMFAKTGTFDARTGEELADFRLRHGLGADAKLDAATRLALTDALARRQTAPPSTGSPAPSPTVPSTPSGKLPTLSGLGAGLTPPSDPGAYRKFRLTTYHVVDQTDWPTGSVRIPILDDKGATLAECSPAFFAKLSLEGTGRLTDGRLVNVTGNKVAASHDTYAPVLEYHRTAYAKGDRRRIAEGKKPAPTTYSGLVTSGDRVVKVLTFHIVKAAKRGVGYGTARNVPYTPFRTLAADIGTLKYSKVDPTWKGKGGLVPPGTHVYIKEYDGLRLPDGTTHDGWFIVNDTGGAIYGVHFDVFTGSEALRKQMKLPAFGQVWFAGIEKRIPPGYTHGLS